MAEAPITQVVLFEDRASVSRRVTLEAGRHELVIEGLSPLVQERHLAFVGDDVDVEEAHVDRVRHELAEADPSSLHEAWKASVEAVRRAEQRRERCKEQVSRARASREAAFAWFPLVLEQADPEPWWPVLRAVSEAAVAAREALAEAEIAYFEHRRQQQALEARLQDARQGRSLLTATLRAWVHARAATTVTVRYTLPCALWRPSHRATLDQGEVAFEAGAVVWNATGEDWDEVELVCSTARPGDEATAPSLTEDAIRVERRRDVVVEAREVEVSRARVMREVVNTGVDDGGETRTFTAPSAVSVPSDGRPIRVPLADWSTEATLSWRCTPSIEGVAVLRSVQQNRGLGPLLAGPVEVFRGGGRIGRTEIGFVPAGEPFSLCWGSHDGLRVARREDRTVERTRVTGHQSQRVKVVVRLSHIGEAPVDVELVERVPVSELKDVTVPPPTCRPPCDAGPDRDGLVTWRLSLAPGDRLEVELTYSIEAPARITLPV